MLLIKWEKATGIAVASLCALASCSRVPSLTPHVSYVAIPTQIANAGLIVVGVVAGEHVVRIVDSPERNDVGRLQLCAVRVHVEGVLKGKFDGDPLTFYYYQVTSAWDGPEPNLIAPGERDIFYLVRDGRVWRAITDAYASHTRLVTGKHSISPATNNEDVDRAVARLLLLPGEDADIHGFLALLHKNKALAISLVGEAEVGRILQNLTKSSDAAIRGRACLTLAEFPLGERECLPNLLHDVHASPEDRARAEELVRQR